MQTNAIQNKHKYMVLHLEKDAITDLAPMTNSSFLPVKVFPHATHRPLSCAHYYPTIQNDINDDKGDDNQMITWWLPKNEIIIRWKDYDRQLPCVQYCPTTQIVGAGISLFMHFPCKFESFVGGAVSCALCNCECKSWVTLCTVHWALRNCKL